ncbi:MAG: hypothetical protein ACJ77A_17665 [Actinomycetota bacterium]
MKSSKGNPAIRAGLVVAMIAALAVVLVPTTALAAGDPSHVSDTLNGCKSDVLAADYISNPFAGATNPKTAFTCTDGSYVGGNLGKGWNELDLVPYRLTESAGTAAPNTQTYSTAVALDSQDAGHPGYDVLTIPTLNTTLSDASCVLSSGPQVTKTPGFGGIDVTIARVLTITQDKSTDCVIDFDGRLAVGSHLFPGASLHANTADQGLTKTGQDRSLPVNQIEPQSISKDMSASQGSNHVWDVTKSPTPASLDFGDTCSGGSGTLSKTVEIEIDWTKESATPDGPVTVITHVYATNPSHRTITVNVTDIIYSGTNQSNAVDTATAAPTDVPANTANMLLLTHSTTASAGPTAFNDVATASYTDKDLGVPIPGTTQATASATVQNNGPVTNDTATIEDSESITGSGLQFSVATPSIGSFSGYTAGTKTTGPVLWESGTLSDTGSVTFDKTVYLTAPGDTSGSLSDTANLTGSDGFTTSADTSVAISAHTAAVLTITKNTSVAPDSDTTFSFTVTGPSNFSSDVDVTVQAGHTSGTGTLGGLADGNYNVHEKTPPSPWHAASDQPFTVAAGACTAGVSFTDNFGPASARALKVTVPAGSEAGWEMVLTGPGTPAGGEKVNTDGTGTVDFTTALQEGAYTITETSKAGWDGDGGKGDCSFTVAYPSDADRLFTCTFTNTQRGTIIVKKVTNPVGAAGNFTFTGDASGTIGDGGTITVNNLQPGTYTSTESDPTPAFDLSGLSCNDGASPTVSTVSLVNRTATFKLDPGETVTCTFINRHRGTIIVKKVTNPVGAAGNFTFTGDASGTIGDGGTITRSNLAPGTYTSTESDPTPAFDLSGVSCNDSLSPTVSTVSLATRTATFKLDPGETVTCTFINRQRGTIVVKKVTNPVGASGNFTFTGDASGTIGDGGTITRSNLAPGTYTSTESDPTPAFDLSGVSCDDSLSPSVSTVSLATRTATFKLDPGETVTCTFTNRARGHVKVVKTVNGGAPSGSQAFTFQLRQGASASAAGTILESGVANATNSGVINFATYLVPGTTYQLCEQLMPGWMTTLGPPFFAVYNPSGDNSVVCTDFTVTAGQTKTFNIDNTPPPGGRALTIGFWKNWASCASSGGKQKPVLDQTLLAAANAGKPITIGNLVLDPNVLGASTACKDAVNLLNKTTIDGTTKKSSDPLFNLAAQLLAADLNVAAGAGVNSNAVNAINQAQALLVKYNFNGNTYGPKLTAADAAKANCLAAALDNYNNDKSVGTC